MKKTYTLQQLLEEIKEQAPRFEKGQFFEVQKSIYPNSDVSSDIKNVMIDESIMTLPLACSNKSKREFKRDKKAFYEFFKETTKGDFIEIIETDGFSAKCINRSLKDDVLKKYYIDESIKYINIVFEDIINGNVKRVYRGIKKYI